MRKLLLIAVLLAAAGRALAAGTIEYTVKLADAHRHLVSVRVHLPQGDGERDLQLPVWNALYQVRDFAQYVVSVSCHAPSGQALAIRACGARSSR